jgi:NADH-quinone oxidoreductase subunit I
MYCGICIEVCPFDALFWSPEFEYATHDIVDLTHERDTLRDWMWTVPAPPADVPNAQLPKEVAAALGEPTADRPRRDRPVSGVPDATRQGAEADAGTAPDDEAPA